MMNRRDGKPKNYGKANCVICKREFEKKSSNHKVCSSRCRKIKADRYREIHKKEIKQYRRIQYKREQKQFEERKKELMKMIGDKCAICSEDSPKKLLFHEIHGKKHPQNLTEKGYKHIFDNIEDFVTLCRACHVNIHRFAILNFKKAIELILRLSK